MIKTILLLLFIIFFAWLTIDYFSITLPTTQLNKQMKHSKSIESSQVSKPQITTSSIESKEKGITLSQLLENNLFYDALALYLDNSTQKNRKQIESYLTALAKTNPTLALEYMQVFLDNVPESMVWKLMISTHIAQGNLERAIELRLATELRDVAMQHIEVLFQRKEYAKLIKFLEDMIAYDGEDNFYKFRLAQLYMRLDKVDEAGMLLEGLQYDEVYAQNVKSLLNIIDKEEEDEYKYAIPLQKYGDHYVVNLFLDDNAFTLILDTGASYIFIDEDKASMLEVIRDDLVLQTAGNNVSAKLCNASSLRVGNLELSNIEVTIAPFKREGIDGLLGMNFFKQFTFFINQEENILYLNPK
jgi:clan AA aspartic protease (TIGR02281 family)